MKEIEEIENILKELNHTIEQGLDFYEEFYKLDNKEYDKIMELLEILKKKEKETLVKTSGLKLYEIKLKHNDGIITIITSGTSEEEEVKKKHFKIRKSTRKCNKKYKNNKRVLKLFFFLFHSPTKHQKIIPIITYF